jgi:hypothetical protein
MPLWPVLSLSHTRLAAQCHKNTVWANAAQPSRKTPRPRWGKRSSTRLQAMKSDRPPLHWLLCAVQTDCSHAAHICVHIHKHTQLPHRIHTFTRVHTHAYMCKHTRAGGMEVLGSASRSPAHTCHLAAAWWELPEPHSRRFVVR